MSPEEVHRKLDDWGRLWGLPDLGAEVPVRSSRRMYRSLGNYSPSRDEIRIAAHLWHPAHRETLLEVLCHEAAHAAVKRLHGRAVRPHGSEWKALMEQAGHPPRTRLPLTPELAAIVRARMKRRRSAPPPTWQVEVKRLRRWLGSPWNPLR